MEIVKKKIGQEESLKSARDNPKEQKKFLDSVRYLISKDNQSLSLDVSTSENYPKLPSSPEVLSQTCLSRNDLHLRKKKIP